MIDRKTVRGYGLIGKQIEEKHEREVNEFFAFMLKEKLGRDFTLCVEPSRHSILKAWVLGIILPNSVEVTVFCYFDGGIDAIAMRNGKIFFHPGFGNPSRTELDEEELYDFIRAYSRIMVK